MSSTSHPTVPSVTPEIPPATWRTMLALLGRLPQGTMSHAFGSIADLRLPRTLRRPVLRTFARAAGIDLTEAEHPLEAYTSLNEFFVRRLRPGIRAWPRDPSLVGSPVDAVAGQVGVIHGGRVVQAKGRWYSAAGLLGSEQEAERFDGGSFATLYLSPRDYHRIHAPCSGLVALARHVPGTLLPVNAAAVAHVPELFARNERLLCYVDGAAGRVAVVAVGAYNVGRISAVFDPAWNRARPLAGSQGGGQRASSVTNRRGARIATRRYDPPVRVRQGDEIMAFHLGSTVVLLFEPRRVTPAAELQPGSRVRLGQVIATAADPTD